MKASRLGPRVSFGPYEILTLLGEGGSGQVYRAWDPRLEREVALKVLRERSETDPARVQRFIAEARAASALNHPNIVTIFDAAVDGDTPFIVSELIDGRSLREEVRPGPLPVERVLGLAAQIADGLSAAHDAGIVHRDLKPDNIMVTRAGRVKIVDFGLARPGGFRQGSAETADPTKAKDLQTQTELGLRGGTVPYMSPEQARGAATDFHSDQFSFGLTLYEMLTGRSAFRRETPAATLNAIINDEPAMAELDPRTPLMLRWIIERCLAKDPNERYGVTADLYRDLRTLRDRLRDVVSREAETGAPSRGANWWRTLAVGAMLAAVAAGVMLTNSLAERPPVDLAALRFSPLATETGYEGLPAWSPDRQTIAYAAEVNGFLQIFTQRLSSPTSAAQVTRAAFDCKYPFWSPDGKRIYYTSLARDRESIWSVGAAGGTPQVTIENAIRAAVTPDGRTLAFLRDEQRGDIVGAAALWLSTPADDEPWSSSSIEAAATRYEGLGDLRFVEGTLSFSPDGTKLGLSVVPRTINLAPERRGWQMWILPLPKGQPYRRLQWWLNAAPRATNFTWLPDSRHIVIGLRSITSPGSDLWMADLANDRAWALTRSADSEVDPSSSPTGGEVVFTRDESEYDLVEIPLDGSPLRPLLATSRNESDPAWSSDGDLLAYVTDRSGSQEIWLRSREGQRWMDRALITQRDFGDDLTIMLSAPSISPDGQQIAYQRNAEKPIWPLRIWISLTGGGAPTPLLPPSHEGYQSAPTWSPDGAWIAYTEWKSDRWMLAKVRVGSGDGPVVLRTDGVPNATPHWSPKGDWITWETDQGFMLVSPDGKEDRVLSHDQWLVHTWSTDGTEILGIKDTEDFRLKLVSINARTAHSRVLTDLGRSLPVNNQVTGLAANADGRSVATSIVRRLRGDLWLLEGLQQPTTSSRWRGLLRFP